MGWGEPARRRLDLAATAAALLSVVLVASLYSENARADPSPSQIIARLNAERVANGIPGGITENPAWTQACRDHIAYMIGNHYFGHIEDPGKPRYSAGGRFAGLNSVLSVGSSWLAGDPFDDAPFHLSQLM